MANIFENASKYAIVAFGRYLEIEQRGQLFSLSCDEKEWNEVWKSYFDLDTDYEDIKRRIAESDDEHLKHAYEKGNGIRILRQDLWEIIVSFIISQNNNIPNRKASCGFPVSGTASHYSCWSAESHDMFPKRIPGTCCS